MWSGNQLGDEIIILENEAELKESTGFLYLTNKRVIFAKSKTAFPIEIILLSEIRGIQT